MAMHVISRRKLREFWTIHPDARVALERWYKLARKAEWESFDEVRVVFGRRVDRVGKLVVFDIGGNKYRLIAAIHYNRGTVFVRYVLTHAEYDRGEWKDG
jgi:mRNA interferase HigB